jgi:hypothetical protein
MRILFTKESFSNKNKQHVFVVTISGLMANKDSIITIQAPFTTALKEKQAQHAKVWNPNTSIVSLI